MRLRDSEHVQINSGAPVATNFIFSPMERTVLNYLVDLSLFTLSKTGKELNVYLQFDKHSI